MNPLADMKSVALTNWKHLQATDAMLLKKLKLFFMEYKTQCEKEKMPITSIFSFSHNVFKSLFPNGYHWVVKD